MTAKKTAVVAKKTAEKAAAVAGKKGKEAVEGVAKKAVAASSASAPSKSPGKKSPGKKVSPTKKAVEEDDDEDEEEEEDSDDANVVSSSSSEDGGGQGATVGKAVGQGVDNVINAGAKVLAGRAPWSGNDGGRARKVSFGVSLGGLVSSGLGRGFLFCFANVDVSQSQSPEKEQQQRARVSTRPAFTSSFSREMKSATETDKISHAAEQESRQSFQGE